MEKTIKMKLSKAQKLAEQAIYDYTSSSKWQQVKYMKWTTAEVQDVISNALVKNFELTAVGKQSELLLQAYKEGFAAALSSMEKANDAIQKMKL